MVASAPSRVSGASTTGDYIDMRSLTSKDSLSHSNSGPVVNHKSLDGGKSMEKADNLKQQGKDKQNHCDGKHTYSNVDNTEQAAENVYEVLP